MQAEFVHMRLEDLGAEIDLDRITSILGASVAEAPVDARRPAPLSSSFPRPLEARLPWRSGAVSGTAEVRVHAVGAVAVRLRWSAPVASLAEVRRLALDVPGGQAGIDEAMAAFVARVRLDLAGALMDAYTAAVAPERYLVYCLRTGPGEASQLLQRERPKLAGLVSDEEGELTVPMRAEAAMRHLLQFTEDDAVIPGWDHAVILGQDDYEDVLDVMELANLELLEFRTYDAYLDRRLDDSFASLDKLWARGGIFRSARRALQEISRVRVELARLTDNLHDTGKVFGDWYTAQLHRRLHERFHLSSWEAAVQSKIATLEAMFHLAEEETNHRRSVILELMIVLLFVLDLVLLLRTGG